MPFVVKTKIYGIEINFHPVNSNPEAWNKLHEPADTTEFWHFSEETARKYMDFCISSHLVRIQNGPQNGFPLEDGLCYITNAFIKPV